MSPRLVVALGATAARPLAERAVTIARWRGRVPSLGDHRHWLVAIHPSYILRLRDEARDAELMRFIADLSRLRDLVPEAGVRNVQMQQRAQD